MWVAFSVKEMPMVGVRGFPNPLNTRPDFQSLERPSATAGAALQTARTGAAAAVAALVPVPPAAMPPAPSQIETQAQRILELTLAPSRGALSQLLGGGQRASPERLHAAADALVRLAPAQMPLVLRRLAMERDALNRLFTGLPSPKLQEIAGTLASALEYDRFTLALLLNHTLSPASLERLSQAGEQLTPESRRAFHGTFGTPAQVQQLVADRAVLKDISQALSTGLFNPVTSDDARRAHDLLMATTPATLNRVVQALASDTCGTQLNAYLHAVPSTDAGKFLALMGRYASAETRAAVLHAVDGKGINAVKAAARHLPPQALEAMFGAAALQQRMTVLSGSSLATQALGEAALQTAAVLTGTVTATQADKAFLAEFANALAARNEPLLMQMLESAGPARTSLLWDQVQSMRGAIPPERYLDTLATKPGQSWDVRWNFTQGKDKDAAAQIASRLLAILPGTTPQQAVGVLNNIRKEFPVHQGGQLEGGTTHSYNPHVLGSGEFTPNVVELRERRGKPVAEMSYSKPPWFHPALKTGFRDSFIPLTPNLILAAGYFTRYASDPSNAPWQFYMVRQDTETQSELQGSGVI